MRRLLTCLGVLCAVVVMAVLATRLTRAEHAAQAQAEAHFAAVCEALEDLTDDLEKAAIAGMALRPELLLQIARSGNMARVQLSALPMQQETAAVVTAVLNDVTAQADSMLCALAAGEMPDEAELAVLAHQRSLCRRLCAQLAIIRSDSGSAYLAADEGAALLCQLADAVCCDGEHDQPTPILQPPAPRGLPIQAITQEEALQLAAAYVDADARRTVQAPDAGGVLPAYGVTVYTDDLRINLEVTQQGGKLLWMTPETASFPQQCTREEARQAVRDYLARHGFGPMEEVAWQLYDGLYMAVMAPVQDQVILYPDVLHVQVRTDTAQVVGFEASGYWTNHTVRSLIAPRLSVSDVLSLLPQELPHSGLSLCLLPMQSGEVLCYQVRVHRDDEEYLLFYSAEDGRQLAMQKLVSHSDGVYPVS